MFKDKIKKLEWELKQLNKIKHRIELDIADDRRVYMVTNMKQQDWEKFLKYIENEITYKQRVLEAKKKLQSCLRD